MSITLNQKVILAARNGNLELLKERVDLNFEEHHGIGPLEIALHSPNSEIVKLLVWSGAKLKKKSREYYGKRLEECLKSD